MYGKEMRMFLKDEKEVEKRKEVPEEKETRRNAKEEQSKDEKPRNNWFLAFLRKKEVPEEKVEEKNAEEKTSNTEEPRNNRFVAFMQTAWHPFSGCFRSRTYSPERSPEELPYPSSGTDEADSKGNVSSTEQDMGGQQSNKDWTSDKNLGSDNGEAVSDHREQDMEGQGSQENQTSDKKVNSDNDSLDLADMLRFYTAKEFLEASAVHSPEEKNGVSVLPFQPHSLEESSLSQIRLEEESNQSDEEAASAAQPLSLNDFTLIKMLGKGGFGMVILARDNIRKEEVALKVVDKCELLEEEDSSLVEHKILQLSHWSPYLIHSPAAFQTLNSIFYVLEYAPRGDLNCFLYKHFPLQRDTVQFIMAELIWGVKFLHHLGIIHRDLKPENILVDGDGHIKITDFGLAEMEVYEDIGNWGFAGTYQYMPPEMLQRKAYGRGMDYYSIGVVFYRLLQYDFPFTGNSLADLAYSVINHKPDFPDDMPSSTRDIVEKLLCKDQFQRLGVNGDVTEHPYFSNINWDDIHLKRVRPPAEMTADGDESSDSTSSKEDNFEKNKKLFQDFSYVNPMWEQQYCPRKLFQEIQG